MHVCACVRRYKQHTATTPFPKHNSDAFGRKRLATHLLIILGALLALPLYALLLARGGDQQGGVCHGLLALHRCQILCALAALALVLRWVVGCGGGLCGVSTRQTHTRPHARGGGVDNVCT